MLIEKICESPHNIVMGLSALVGAGAYAAYSIHEAKKKLGIRFKLDVKRLVDTAWQSVLAGIAAGVAIGCSWPGVLVAMVTGIGVDKIANKFKIKKTQILNFVQLIAGFIASADKKK